MLCRGLSQYNVLPFTCTLIAMGVSAQHMMLGLGLDRSSVSSIGDLEVMSFCESSGVRTLRARFGSRCHVCRVAGRCCYPCSPSAHPEKPHLRAQVGKGISGGGSEVSWDLCDVDEAGSLVPL